MNSSEIVNRPTKKSEYEIRFASKQAKKGWADLKAARLNGLVDTWEFLTKTPDLVTPLNHKMRGELEFIFRDGNRYERWQIKISPTYGARIWYYIFNQTVYLEQVHTNHPHETK